MSAIEQYYAGVVMTSVSIVVSLVSVVAILVDYFKKKPKKEASVIDYDVDIHFLPYKEKADVALRTFNSVRKRLHRHLENCRGRDYRIPRIREYLACNEKEYSDKLLHICKVDGIHASVLACSTEVIRIKKLLDLRAKDCTAAEYIEALNCASDIDKCIERFIIKYKEVVDYASEYDVIRNSHNLRSLFTSMKMVKYKWIKEE